jgi:hypothetical protein
MKSEEIKKLFAQFEAAAVEIDGIECWSARELQKLLGYTLWQNFEKVLVKAKNACENVSENVLYHFIDVNKTIEHIDNNLGVRKIMVERGLVPENLPSAEDVKKLQRRLANEDKKLKK